jgi:hypothetical protein
LGKTWSALTISLVRGAEKSFVSKESLALYPLLTFDAPSHKMTNSLEPQGKMADRELLHSFLLQKVLRYGKHIGASWT